MGADRCVAAQLSPLTYETRHPLGRTGSLVVALRVVVVEVEVAGEAAGEGNGEAVIRRARMLSGRNVSV